MRKLKENIAMDFLNEDMLGFIPVVICAGILLIAGIIYKIVQYFKNK